MSFFYSCVGGFVVFAWRNIAPRMRASMVALLVKKIHLQCGRPRFALWVGRIPWRRARLWTLAWRIPGTRSLVGSRAAGADALSCLTRHARALGQGCDFYRPPRAPPHTEQGCDFGLPKNQKHVSIVARRGQWESLTSPCHAEVCFSRCLADTGQSGDAEMRERGAGA